MIFEFQRLTEGFYHSDFSLVSSTELSDSHSQHLWYCQADQRYRISSCRPQPFHSWSLGKAFGKSLFCLLQGVCLIEVASKWRSEAKLFFEIAPFSVQYVHLMINEHQRINFRQKPEKNFDQSLSVFDQCLFSHHSLEHSLCKSCCSTLPTKAHIISCSFLLKEPEKLKESQMYQSVYDTRIIMFCYERALKIRRTAINRFWIYFI